MQSPGIFKFHAVVTTAIVSGGLLLTAGIAGCPTGQVCGACTSCGGLLPIGGIASYLWYRGIKQRSGTHG